MSVETLFHQALAQTDPGERAAFLQAACAGQPDLLARVEALLAAHAGSDDLWDKPLTERMEPTADFAPRPPAPSREGTDDYQPGTAPGILIAGRYTLQELIGEGGMGEVWIAKQSEPVKRIVALKLIKAGMDSKAVLARFEQERQALAVMDHPHIAKVFDAGLTNDRRPFFVMELVNGLSLMKFCDAAKLTPQERLGLFIPICQAVQHAHQKGIVHRDLKPGNILVTMIDGRPVPKVIDFGVAKAVTGKLTDESLATQFGAVVGTLEYMAPEQAGYAGQDTDTRADIYSLGVILYELLTGLRPIDGKRLRQAAISEMIRILKEEEPSKPSTRLSTDESLPSMAALRQMEPKRLTALLRGDLDWIVMKCLEKDRNRRYETANQLALEVQRYLADEPVMAGPPGTSYRLRKFVKRHRGPVIAAALVLLALLGGIIGATWGLVEARAAEHLAEERRLQAVQESQRADQEAGAARKAEADTAAFSSFLVNDILSVARPEGVDGGLGIEVTVARALAVAETKLATVFAGRPLAEAQARLAIGSTWRNMGKYEDAERHLRIALDLLRRELPADHPQILEGGHSLGVTLLQAGRYPEAVNCLEQVRDGRRRLFGEENTNTLGTMTQLAYAYRRANRVQEAIDLLLKVREVLLRIRGPENRGTLTALNSLAGAYAEARQFSQAVELFEQVLKAQRKVLPPNHPDIFTTANDLAMLYSDHGKLPQAIELYKEVRAGQTASLGADHPYTLITMNNLAMAHAQEGKPELALALFREAAAGSERRRFRHQYADRIVGNLIIYLERRRLFAEAETWRRKWLAHVAEKSGPESLAAAEEMAQLGRNLLLQGKGPVAEPVLRECLTLWEKAAPNDWRGCNVRSMLGEALYLQRKYAEAEAPLLQGYDGLKQRQAAIPPGKQVLVPEALARLVRLYDATGNKAEAAKRRKELETPPAAPKQSEKQP